MTEMSRASQERVQRIKSIEQIRGLAGLERLPGLSAQEIALSRPNGHWVALDSGDAVSARCSLWWTRTPHQGSHRLGLIGHYAALNPAAGVKLLEAAERELKVHGCTLAVGPMDGSTWRGYRFVTDRGEAPPFLLEPDNPPEWPALFQQRGFQPLAEYFSSATTTFAFEDPKAARAEHRLVSLGVSLRPLALDDFEGELQRVYQLVVLSFAGGFLYQPLAFEEFHEQFLPLKGWLSHGLSLIAMHEGQHVGLVLVLPDLLQNRSARQAKTAIIKTLAIHPDRQYAGLGSWLAAAAHRAAGELGYQRVIHALMHSGNRSLNISGRYGQPFRRYTLFSKVL
jgi:GNAT superfamily N-acetyltransferase